MSDGTSPAMRDLLLGDFPAARWPERDGVPGEPWRAPR